MQHELDCMGHSLRYMNDTKCTLEVTGNDNQDVELCLLHNPFVTDLPESIKRHYDQILGLPDENQLVKVNGNMPTLEETIWLLNNLVEVHKISITSPTARLKELDLELKLSLCSPTLNSMGDIDTLNFNQNAKFKSPSEAYIDLTEEPFDFSISRIFMSINVKAGSLFNLSFIGHLKDTANPLSFMQKSSPVPQFCQSCGAPLHDGKCDYCGADYRCSGTMLSSQKKSDYNTKEKEKQRRRFGRAEIILIIQLVTIFAMIYLFSSCSNKDCFNPFNRSMSNVVLDTIYPLQFPNATYGNSIWSFRKHFSIIKINHHEYIFYNSPSQVGLCHYEDCEYCNNNNP